MFRFLLCGFEKMKKEMGVAGRSWFSSVVGPIGSEFRSWREEGRGRKDSRKGGKMERVKRRENEESKTIEAEGAHNL